MVDFDTLKGIDGYRAAFPSVFAGMNEADAERVVSPVHNNVLAGWEPTTEDVQHMADAILAPGPTRMTTKELHDLVHEITGHFPAENGDDDAAH